VIDRLIAALREAELKLDWRDIADVLWLADVRARDAASESGEPPADGGPTPAEPRGKPLETGGATRSDGADISPTPTKPAGLQEVTPVRPVGWRLTERGDADNSGGAGLEAAAPASYALPGGMEISRALRPMKQQRHTSRRKVFDPEATVDLFCDTGVLVPVLRAGSERWFDVAVVADNSATMAIWDDTITAFADLLERHGAFRGVTRWALAEQNGAIEIRSPSGLAHRPHELLDLAGRRLMLVVTDAVDALWARAPVWEALRAWGMYGPVGLVQVLPPRSWAQTRLGEADAAVVASRPGQPNHQLEVVPPWWWLEGKPPDHVVPVVGLDEASLSPWVRMVMGAPGVSVPGVLAVPEDDGDGGACGQVRLPGEVDLDRLSNVLRSTVSAQAYRLAVLLSAVEVSLPIARIVMHELMPHARLAHLAELIAAGVLKAARLPAPGVASAAVRVGAPLSAAPPGGHVDRSQVALTFAPGLRELFQRSLTVTMTLQVWRAVAPYLEATHGLRRFSLLLQPPHAELDAAAGADELREGLQAITADLAGRLGLVPSPAADWQPSDHADDARRRPPPGGRFTRLFPDLPGARFDQADLARLANEMTSRAEWPVPETMQDPEENPGIPAAYTYLGQFVDHDLTFDPTSSLRESLTEAQLRTANIRTPRFDLDILYGRGPDDQHYMYKEDGIHMLLGERMSGDPFDPGAVQLPRGPDGRALIGGPRNDENRIVAQLHAIFLRFHNKVVDQLGGKKHVSFREVREQVRWHYQWVLVNDFLPRILEEQTYRSVFPDPYRHVLSIPRLQNGLELMPVEFSVAAYRFGHSMIRSRYRLNSTIERPIFSGVPGDTTDLRGFRPIPANWAIDWQFFIDLHYGARPAAEGSPAGPAARKPQLSYKIDTSLVHPLGRLPAQIAKDPSSLALRNLERGVTFQLPSGQNVAMALGLPVIADEELVIGKATAERQLKPLIYIARDFVGNAPLWTYILSEAQVTSWKNAGPVANRNAIPIRLGPVGGRLVAEVFASLLRGDPTSYLYAEPVFKPIMNFTHDGTFGLAELINVALGLFV
jgi:Animal haem peroxidase